MAPDSRHSASPAKCGGRAWDASERGVPGCAVPVPSTLLLLLTYLTYLVLGTCVFWLLESPAAHDSSKRFQRDKWALLRNFTCLDGPALDSLIRGIIEAYKNGDIVLGNTTSMGRWEFVGSFFFSVSTITTIGKRRMGPRPQESRDNTSWKQISGYPGTCVVLHRETSMLGRPLDSHSLSSRAGGAADDPAKARWLAGSSALLSGLLLFLLLPPLLFNHMEGWTYVEGFYFSFITLSTVGFGDYVIGMNPSRNYPLWYQNTVSLWILFGMAWLALIIKLILSILEAPRESYSCYPQSSKGNFKPRSWRQALDEEAGPHSPQPSCSPEGQHPEPSTQVSCCGKDS
ncbi:hypothetical protein K5549_005141 [Capra hircus]|nr:hypothetical protein K5549_005141 [Capra hircus]